MIKIHLKCDPPTATAQQKGIRIILPKDKMKSVQALWKGGPGNVYKILRYCLPMHFEKEELKLAKRLFAGLLTPYQISKPLEGPVALDVIWVFPWRKTEKKGVTREFQRYPKDTKPDVDNSNKLLLDVMTFLEFWKDDGQICDLRLRKFWGDEPGIWIKVIHGPEMPESPRKEGDLFAK